jgi:hypothetical protein
MSKKWPGGIITPTPATPSGPYQNGAAPGIWTLSQQSYWAKQGLWPIAGNAAPIGFMGGGVSSGTRSANINYFSLTSVGNATSFGNLTVARLELASCASTTRGLWAGGENNEGDRVTTIDYITMASTGTASSFGALTQARMGLAGLSNTTRGVFGGGASPSGLSSVIATQKKYFADKGCVQILEKYRQAELGKTIGKFSSLDKARIEAGSVYERNQRIFFGALVLLGGVVLITMFGKNK